MLRRSNQTGSVFRRSDGRWVASLMVGGKRVTRYTRSETDAWAELTRLTTAARLHQSPILREWLVEWLDHKRAVLRAISWHRYSRSLALIYGTAVAELPLEQVNAAALRAAFTEIATSNPRAGLSFLYTILSHALEEAVEVYELLPANPMRKVPKPKAYPLRRDRWDVAQAQRFLAYLAGAVGDRRCRRCPAFVVALLTGLRWSEVNGLRWEDVHLDPAAPERSYLWVRRVVYFMEAEKRWVTAHPKSPAGQRQLFLPLPAHQALAALAAAEGQEGPVFWTRNGTPVFASDANNLLRSVCRRLGLPRISPHGLRHAAATLARAATGSDYAVQRMLGHSSVSTTTRLYGYQGADPQATAAAVARLLGGGQT